MTEIEFVNREIAETEAARAIGLLNASDESKVEAWFALQAVADQVGEASNTGHRGITYATSKRSSSRAETRYQLTATCVDGYAQGSMVAPATLEEACGEPWIGKALALRERLISEHGGLRRSARPQGTSLALIDAVGATAQGKEWLARYADPNQTLLTMVRIADAYGRDGVCLSASIGAHQAFLKFAEKATLVREFPTAAQARAKVMSLTVAETKGTVYAARDEEGIGEVRNLITMPMIRKLARTTGTTNRESRVILQAVLDGRSETKLKRLVREALRMAEDIRQNDENPLEVAA